MRTRSIGYCRVLLLLCLTFLPIFDLSARAEGPALGQSPVIAGLRLAMTLQAFTQRYPEAVVTVSRPELFCHQERLVADRVESAKAQWAEGHTWITAHFHRQDADLLLHSVEYQHPLAFHPDDFEALRREVSQRFGPYSRLLLPSKLEAARLIVGFEWSTDPAYLLTYRVHGDTHSGSNDTFVTQRLSNWLSGSALQEAAFDRLRAAQSALKARCDKKLASR